jgi:hypothetical protein
LDRTNRTELIEQDCHYRAAKKDSPGKTKRRGQQKRLPEQDSWIGQADLFSQNRTVRTGHPGQGKQTEQDRTASTLLSGQDC